MESQYENNEENIVFKSRFQKNEELYKEIKDNDLNNYDIKSNAEVIGDNKAEIDVEKIKKILDTKYNEVPRRKSLRAEEEEAHKLEEDNEIQDTKEYDINVVIEKAKEKKDEVYEEERLKMIHNTQFEILKKLELEETGELEDTELKELIDTIAINEDKKDDSDVHLDILSDLKGNENTEKLDGLKDEITMKTNDIIDLDMSKDIKKIEKEDDDEDDEKLINSFYTSSNAIKKKDFEEDDFKSDIEKSSIATKIIIGIIALVFIIGIIILIKTIFF